VAVDRKGFARIDPNRFGPWAVVTGASSGIGREFTRQLAASGLDVVLVSRRVAVLEELGEELKRDFGVATRVVEADLSDPHATDIVAARTADLDVGLLISNAGTGQPGNFLAFDEHDLRSISELNAVSYLVLTHHFGRRLAARGKGGVLLVSALGADSGIPFNANAAATKGMVSTLGRGLHAEFEALGLHLTVLVVTPTDTPIIEKMGLDIGDMPMRPMSVTQCVREALRALEANQMIVLPGLVYRIMNQLVPHAVARAMTARMMKRSRSFVT